MAAKWTIDNLNRLLIVNFGVTELDVEVDLYSDWKEEYQLTVNSKFPPAFRTAAGDPISGTQDLGAGYFLINGWKIRPHEADHQLNITGDLFTDPSTEPIAVPTLGAFTVTINLIVSALTRQIQTAVSGLTALESAALLRIEQIIRNRRILDQADGKLKVLDDASLAVLLEALAWENAAGTQAYRGQGVERTDRLEAP